MDNILSIIETSVGNRTVSRLHGVEYCGPCPWCGGTDRFHVWPDENFIPGLGALGLYQCMGQSAGRSGCGRSGDMVKYVQERRGMGFSDACVTLHIDKSILLDYRKTNNGTPEKAPSSPVVEKAKGDSSKLWQERADSIGALAHQCLMSERGKPGLAYLQSRGLHNEMIADAQLGYCRTYSHDEASAWGYTGGKMLLPRGIVIPWRDEQGRVVSIRFRRLPSDESQEARKFYGVDKTGAINRYRSLFGSSSTHLYREHTIIPGCSTVLLEGELDALATVQALDHSVSVVATGSTSWGRSASSLALLSNCSLILVCYDADEAGDKASKYWLDTLANARRWRPLWSDANDMMRGGVDIATWVQVGLTVQLEKNKTDEDVPLVRDELAMLVQADSEQWEVSTELDPRWPASAKVYKRIRKVA